MAVFLAGGATAATLSVEQQQAVRAATFEVVLRKAERDTLSYEKPLPLDLVPFYVRNDKYWSIGTAFAIGPSTYASAAHVLIAALDSQFGTPALRDGAGHVYAIKDILKFSVREDYVVFDLVDAPPATPLATNSEPKLDDAVFAVGNALGEGVVIRDGLLTSETPEDQDGAWKWLRFSAAASPGNSGGPLLDPTGRVIGVVRAKSSNENLNYAVPIGRVLAAPAEAIFDTRYTARLPYTRATSVATLKQRFALPEGFGAFSRHYQATQLEAVRRDAQQLQQSQAGSLFPKGDSAKLLATVYQSPLPGFVQQDNNDQWDVLSAQEQTEQPLPGHGLVATGQSLGVQVFRLKRPDGQSDPAFYTDPVASMDLLLKGLKLQRGVGDQEIRITSLGRPAQERGYRDGFGRQWQVRQWPLGYADSVVVVYALPVPEGYVGMATMMPTLHVAAMDEYLKLLADHVYLTYGGTLAQWRMFLAQKTLRPALFDREQLTIGASDDVRFESERLHVSMDKGLIGSTDASELDVRMTYLLDGDRLVWDVGGLLLSKDDLRHTALDVQRHPKPASDQAREAQETWDHMRQHTAEFTGVGGHDDGFNRFWIHNAVSQRVGADANVYYDVGYETDAHLLPRDLEQTEQQLILNTHVLEH